MSAERAAMFITFLCKALQRLRLSWFYSEKVLMLGWWIIISSHTPKERDQYDDKSAMLATCEASVGGRVWIDALVSEGKTTQLLFGGYPCRYTAAAKHIFPLIQHGPPKHTAPVVFGDDYVSDGRLVCKIHSASRSN